MTAASSDQSLFFLCFTFSMNPVRRLPSWHQDGLKRIRTQTKDRKKTLSWFVTVLLQITRKSHLAFVTLYVKIC